MVKLGINFKNIYFLYLLNEISNLRLRLFSLKVVQAKYLWYTKVKSLIREFTKFRSKKKVFR